MDNFEYCGTVPRKWWLLGQMAAVQDFLQDAGVLMRLSSGQAVLDPSLVRFKVMAAHDIVARLASRSSHCELSEGLESASGNLGDLSLRLSDGSVPIGDLQNELQLLIRIIIKIGKLIITIEF